MEQAISLRDAAARLGVSYQTIFQHRQRIGFRLPGGRKWLVLPSRLAELAQPRYNVTRIASVGTSRSTDTCQSDNVMGFGGSISARQAAKELDALLARRTKGRRKNITTA